MDKKILYTKLTTNIERKLDQFNSPNMNANKININLLLNLTSLCRFMKNREVRKQEEQKEKQKLEELQPKAKDHEEVIKEINGFVNETVLDVFVPYSRLSSTIQKKLSEIRLTELNEKETDNDNHIKLDFENDVENPFDNDYQFHKTDDLDNIYDDDKIDQIDDNNSATLNYLDDNQSISMSLFNQPISQQVNDNEHSRYKNEFAKKIPSANNLQLHEFHSASTFKNNEDNNIEIAIQEFQLILKDKGVIKQTVKDMGLNYLRYIYDVYQKIDNNCVRSRELLDNNKNVIFINQFKSFVLDIGISDKKFYEQCIREIIYATKMFEFSEFLECFRKLLINVKFDHTFLKYKFLFHIVQRKNEDYFEDEDLEKFYDLVYNCKKIYEPEIYEDIKRDLVRTYKKVFPSEKKKYTRQLSLVLETFFELK